MPFGYIHICLLISHSVRFPSVNLFVSLYTKKDKKQSFLLTEKQKKT